MDRKILLFFLLGVILVTALPAQVVLKPTIGLSAIPADGDSVCPIQVFTGNYNNVGIAEGDTIPQFKLYSLSGDSLEMAAELNKGKHILLVTGAYTCPVFRNKVTKIHTVAAAYSDSISTFIIYVVEAHPDIDPSPYSGQVWTTSQNQSSGILYRQPVTYGARKTVVSDMINAMNITVPVFIDGPCNAYWNTFGPAPNNAYLIRRDGVVFSYQGWFDKAPDNITAEIDSLLGNGGGGGNPVNGTFNLRLDTDTVVYGIPGTTLTIKGMLKNNSAADAEIDIVRLNNNLPAGWESAICTDVCYPPWTDSAYVYLYAGDSLLFNFYFYADSVPATGNARIGFYNRNVTNNRFVRRFYGNTTMQVAIPEISGENISMLHVYPNPVKDQVHIAIPVEWHNEQVIQTILNLDGRKMQEVKTAGSRFSVLNISALAPGMYIVRSVSADGAGRIGRFIKQ